MSLVFILWLIIVLFFLWFWAWTSYVTYRQKKAWRLYAEKRNLRFYSNGILETPSLNGAIDGYKLSVFASEHSELDPTSQRRLTAIEIFMHTSLPTQGALASGGMVSVIEPLPLSQEYKPDFASWDDSYIVRTSDNDVMAAYLTSERLDKLTSLMEVKKAWIVFLFLSDTGILRFDTPLPIDDPRELDKIVKQLIDAAKVLELKDGEYEKLLRKLSKSVEGQPQLKIDDDLLKDKIGLELEEDDEA